MYRDPGEYWWWAVFSQHDTSRGSDLLEQRQELSGPSAALAPLHRRVSLRPARVRDGLASFGQQPGAAGDLARGDLLCLNLVWEETVSGAT